MVSVKITKWIKKLLYNKHFIDKGILYVQNILDDNGNFLDHAKMVSKFNLITIFIARLQLKSCIPADLKTQISNAKIQTSKIPDGNFI